MIRRQAGLRALINRIASKDAGTLFLLMLPVTRGADKFGVASPLSITIAGRGAHAVDLPCLLAPQALFMHRTGLFEHNED